MDGATVTEGLPVPRGPRRKAPASQPAQRSNSMIAASTSYVPSHTSRRAESAVTGASEAAGAPGLRDGRPTGWPADRLAGRLAGWPTDWPTDWLGRQPADRLASQFSPNTYLVDRSI